MAIPNYMAVIWGGRCWMDFLSPWLTDFMGFGVVIDCMMTKVLK